MRTPVAISVAVLLSSCATSPTPQSFQAGSPESVYVSDKSPQTIADCIISAQPDTLRRSKFGLQNASPNSARRKVPVSFTLGVRKMGRLEVEERQPESSNAARKCVPSLNRKYLQTTKI